MAQATTQQPTLTTRKRKAKTGSLRPIEPPYGAQLEFIKSGALYKLFLSGQGGGKTLAGVFEVRRYAKLHPGSKVICTEPTYPMIRDILQPEFRRQFELAGEATRVRWMASESKYVLWNGSEIWLRQCDQFERVRGPTVAAAWMDEAAQAPHDAFRILSGRLRQPGHPHCFWFTSTPRGKGWLYWSFTKGDRPEWAAPYIGDQPIFEDNVAVFRSRATDNPYLDAVSKAILLAAYPPGTKVHDQEVGGETIVYEGLVYSMFRTEDHVKQSPDPKEFVRVVGGIDWGWAAPGAAVVVGLDRDGVLWVCDEEYEMEKSIEWWAESCKRLEAQWGVAEWHADPSEPRSIMKMCHLGVRTMPAINDVMPGIQEVGARMATDRLMIAPSCSNVLAELAGYQWKQSRQGEVQGDVPEKANDHAMDGLRYAVVAQGRRKGTAGIASSQGTQRRRVA